MIIILLMLMFVPEASALRMVNWLWSNKMAAIVLLAMSSWISSAIETITRHIIIGYL